MGNAKKEEVAKDKKTLNSTRNEQQKAKSRVAAQARRKNENENFEKLSRLVPCIPDNPADKSTIIRLSTSYIGLMKVLKGSRNAHLIGDNCSETQGVENQSLEVLDGFIIVLSRDGTITFVNDRVVSYLGFPPHELMGKKIYNFTLKKDWDEVARKLRGPLPCLDNPNVKEPHCDPDDVICEPDSDELLTPILRNATWNETVEFSVRMQCNLVRRTNPSKSTGFQIVRFRGRLNDDGFFLGTGEYAWSPDLGDLPVYEPAFISRLTHDLKLLFCEGRIHRYMDSEAKDLVGRVVYPFYHPTDVFHIQKMHSKLLAEGKVTTVPYRWMNKDGGWVWLKSTTTRIQDEKTGKGYVLCVNYVLSAIENKGVVVGVNPETNDKIIERTNEEKTENDSSDAYLVDALTEAFTKSNPFDSPSCRNGAIEDVHGGSQNVFDTNYQQKPRYAPPFTSSETRAKPLLEFYTEEPEQLDPLPMMEEQTAESRFERLTWPQGEQPWREERTMPQQNHFNNIYNSQHVEQFQLQDFLFNGHFGPELALLGDQQAVQAEPVFGDIYELKQAEPQSDKDYFGLDEPFIQQTHGFVPYGHVKAEHQNQTLHHDISEQFEMPDMLDDEEIAYTASMYLFMNEVPGLDEKSAQMSNNHLQHNGFTHNMLSSNQEQCYNNFPQVNHNNNILPTCDIMHMASQLTNGKPMNLNRLAEEDCINDFDPRLLEASI